MNANIAKYGDRRGCVSRFCSGKRPPDHGFCSSYSCHYSRDFKPGQAWKFYYKQQKLQEYEQKKQTLLKRLSRCHGKDVMQCVVRGLRKLEGDSPPSPAAYDVGSDFYVRPWQQQFIPPLQEPPCPVHGFDRESNKCIAGTITLCQPRCSQLVYCCEPSLRGSCCHLRYSRQPGNPLQKYAPVPAYLIQPCLQLPNKQLYRGLQQPCLHQEPPWCVPQFCSVDSPAKKEWPDINELWHLK